jgi:hypothetical protein
MIVTQQPNELRVRWSQTPSSPRTPSPPRKDFSSQQQSDDDDHDRSERKWNLRSIQILLLWAIAKSKMRYYLGLYTFMLTVSHSTRVLCYAVLIVDSEKILECPAYPPTTCFVHSLLPTRFLSTMVLAV